MTIKRSSRARKSSEKTYETHRLGVLARQRTQSPARTDNGYRLASSRPRFLEALVNGYARAKHGCNGIKWHALRDSSNMRSLANGVLLKGPVDSVTRQ